MGLALCPGSFDPPTNGHIEVVEGASRHFERVLVAVGHNSSKTPLLGTEERVELLRGCLAHLHNVEIESFKGLLTDLARERGAAVIVKGLRAASDLDYELAMARINATLQPSLDTLFIVTSSRFSFVSSSLVKEAARYGGDISGLVPPQVNKALIRHFETNPDRV
ncbi:MAG: pantetheine-phosphate adenylyltransferase [Actinomycetota bacterium]